MTNGVFYRVILLVLMPWVYNFPQILCQNTAQPSDPSSSTVFPDPAVTVTISRGDSSGKPVDSAATDTARELIDETYLKLNPFTFESTTGEDSNELRAKSNSLNTTSTPNYTITDGSVVFPTDATLEPITIPKGCLCDITPQFCDIGCCCDILDCSIPNLSSVFNNCGIKTEYSICLESWLVFKAQVDPALVTFVGDFICFRRETETEPNVLTSSARLRPRYFYPHIQRQLTAFNNPKSTVYKADDVVLTYYDQTSIFSTLRQPSPGLGSSACINHNPTRFLRSSSTSCSRVVTAHSCVNDRSLKPLTYYNGFTLLKVEYVIKYTSNGAITEARLNIELLNITTDTQLWQQHVVAFEQLATPTPPMATPTAQSPSEGLKLQSPLVGWFGGRVQPETCDKGCLLPVSLTVQVLWAQTGLRALPQSHILGAKFTFVCQKIKCPLRSSVPVSTEVIFSESTVYPESPRGERQPEWKFPFAFFSRGVGELDKE
ncbi:hypothetical protein DNTS_028666 [Danionella cerebrum]|uniref:Uncharacterized protein n=1 Tax=Danionella cerebrum TaxID=2873325 RepID=A0A553MYK7_9TELE|nr:hypothetical protein DNTS_028666 [Danionella translucida]